MPSAGWWRVRSVSHRPSCAAVTVKTDSGKNSCWMLSLRGGLWGSAHVHPLQGNQWDDVCVLSHSAVSDSLWSHGPKSPGSSVCGVLQARVLEWVTILSFRGSSWPRDQTWVSWVSCTGRQVLHHWATWEACRGTLLWGAGWRLMGVVREGPVATAHLQWTQHCSCGSPARKAASLKCEQFCSKRRRKLFFRNTIL